MNAPTERGLPMAETIASPDIDKLFSKAGKAFRLLTLQGVDVVKFLDKIIGEPKFREVIFQTLTIDSPTDMAWSEEAQTRLICAAFDMGAGFEPTSRNAIDLRRFTTLIEENGGINNILKKLRDMQTKVLWLRYAFSNSADKVTQQSEIAQTFRMTGTEVNQLERSGLRDLRFEIMNLKNRAEIVMIDV